MFYSKQSFLKDIGAHSNTVSEDSLLNFSKNTIIAYKKPISILEFIKTADKDDKRMKNTKEWIEYFYSVLVINRIEVLTRFYNSYLYTPEMDNLFSVPLINESIEELEKSLID
jgi:hypothetical protein